MTRLESFSMRRISGNKPQCPAAQRVLSTISLCVLILLAQHVNAASFAVTKTADTNDGACNADCSLREAVIAANTTGGPDTISIPAGTYNLTLGVPGEDFAATGDLDITEAVNISGAGVASTILDGTGNDRVFDIAIGAQVQISDLTVRNGSSTSGGGVRNLGDLTLSDLVITNNSSNTGGGLYMEEATAKLTMVGVTISSNDAGSGAGLDIKNSLPSVFTDVILDNNTGAADGGGLFLEGNTLTFDGGAVTNHTATGKGAGIHLKGSVATFTELVIDGNSGGTDGGGLYNETSNTIILKSQISGNGAGNGGGVFIKDGPLRLENTTVSGNTSPGAVGGVHSQGDATLLLNSTVVNNTGRGVRDEGADVELTNTIIANNTIDCQGGMTINGGNLDSDGSCGVGITADPLLGPLQNNGGPTLTHAPGPGSPIINAGINAGCPADDQRSAPRPIDTTCDIGAVEATVFPVSGRLFVDIVGDGLADGPIGPLPNPFESGARIELWADGGDGIPDGGDDIYAGFTTSSGTDGSYTFGGNVPGIYWITVDSRGVDRGPYNGGYSGIDIWAEQTWGPAGAARFDGVSWSFAATSGSVYGGARWDMSDNFPPTNSLPTAEHIARADLTSGPLANMDFGFSFNVVTTTRGGSAAQDPGAGAGQRTVQGSLRQFLTNSNAQSGSNIMRFVPAAPTNGSDGGNSWWSVNLTSLLPVITDTDTTIDGNAFALSDGTTTINPNNANIGAGETVGVDGSFTTPVLDPEFEVVVSGLDHGLDIQAGSVAVRNISIWQSNENDIRVGDGAGPDFTGPTIEQNVIGTPPYRFDASFAPTGNDLIDVFSEADSGVLQNNLIGFANGGGFSPNTGALSWLVLQNEIRGTGRAAGWGAYQDAIGDGASGIIVRGNLLVDNAGGGVESNLQPGGFTIEQNTFRNNGMVAPETFSIRLMGTTGNSVTKNIFESNNGPAIIVVSDRSVPVYAASEANHISQNRFSDLSGSGDNAGIAIDLLNAGSPDNEHDNGDGITLNDGGTNDNDGNNGIDYPIIDSAGLGGGSLRVTGFSRPGVEMEFYLAVGQANDQNAGGTAHGEGVTYLFTATEGSAGDSDGGVGSYGPADFGTDPAAQRFDFSVAAPAGVSVGDEISAIAWLPADGSSEFGPNFVVAATGQIAGTVFEDIAANLLDGTESIGDINNPAIDGVQISLYNDDGATASQPDATDTLHSGPIATAGGGAYVFSGLPDGTYWVVVNSKTVSADNNVWAEQTYAPQGGWCADGAGSTTQGIVAAGTCFGGRRVDPVPANPSSDDLTTWHTGAEHIAEVAVSGGVVSDIDFGFSFNAVTTSRGGGLTDDDGANPRSVQGSLRQFIQNANAIGGANTMRFIPAEPANASSGGNSWWRFFVTAAYPQVQDVSTTIDGAAFNLADGVTPRNTNNAAIGAGATVGVTGAYNTPQLDPELEIRGDTVVNYGVYLRSTADGSTVRNLALNAFNFYSIGIIGALPDDLANVTVENNVIGTSPASFTDDPSISTGRGLFGRDLSNAIIRDNLVGWVGWGLQVQFDTFDSLIETNEIRGIDTYGLYLAGVSGTGQQPARDIVRGNLIESSGTIGINTTDAEREITITENTLRLTGGHGASIHGTQNTITNNIVTDNSGTGLLLVSDTSQTYLSQNQFGNNSQLAIDLVQTGINPDGPTLNDNLDPDAGANTLLNFPVIQSAFIAGPDLVLTGFAPAGSSIEFYLRDADPSQFGEGATYLVTAVEGSGGDLDGTTGSYGPGPVNGIPQGTEANAARFEFRVATGSLPAPVALGNELTATATIGAGLTRTTSEFGGAAPIATDLEIVKRAFFPDGTPIPSGETLPLGVEFKYLLYINNRNAVRNDVSMRDVLDPAFAYQPGSIRIDNTVVACATDTCTPAEEAAIFSAANAGLPGSDAVDADTVSYTPAGTTLDAGNEFAANAQLDIAANRVWAMIFSAKIQ